MHEYFTLSRVYPSLRNQQIVEMRQTKWAFYALCCYLLTQAYTIPILLVGPWPLWLQLADFASGLLIFSVFVSYWHSPLPSISNRYIFLSSLCLFWLCLLSWTIYLFFHGSPPSMSESYGVTPGTKQGAFQIYKFICFFGVLWATRYIPLPEERINILRKITTFVLIIVNLGVFITFSDIVPLSSIAPHLPSNPDIAGPWFLYSLSTEQIGGDHRGWGTIGYNHAYVATHILLITSLRMHLAGRFRVLSNSFLLFISLLGTFMTGSRNGLAIIMIYAMIYWVRRPVYGMTIILCATIIGLASVFIMPDTFTGLNSSISSLIERQQTIINPTNTENLSGRDVIWQQRMEFLDENPIRWIIGSGFGSAPDSGQDAHMLYLHLILEIGLIGLTVFLFFFVLILQSLYHNELGGHAVFYATAALLLSSISQETLYPVASQGGFLGFYLCSVAIALRSPDHEKSIVNRKSVNKMSNAIL